MASSTDLQSPSPLKTLFSVLLGLGAALVVGVLFWQGITASGAPDPETAHISPGVAIMNTGILVFREGLEAILVLAALTASMRGSNGGYRKPIAMGAGLALLASVITWFVFVGLIEHLPWTPEQIQAATGLLAIVVLLVIMNWFFHNVYWTGWISMHNKKKRNLMAEGVDKGTLTRGLLALGFTAMYREGFEIVLFLQNLRIKAGTPAVMEGMSIGLVLTAIVGVLTFVAHQHLPYKKMLILTGVMLAAVLILMVGENIQELQDAKWMSEHVINGLNIPEWMGTWFAIFPNREGIFSQILAAVLIFGSYFMAHYLRVTKPTREGGVAAHRPDQEPSEAPSSRSTGHGVGLGTL